MEASGGQKYKLDLAAVGVFGSYPLILVALAVVGVGTGLTQPRLNTVALDAALPGRSAAVAGVMTSAMFCGQFASPFISSAWEHAASLAISYIIVGAGAAVIGAVGALFTSRLSTTGDRESSAVTPF